MEAPPTAALIMPEANFLFEVFIIALDAPAHLGEIDKAAEQHVRVDGCEPVLGRCVLALGPFDEQRFFGKTCFAPDRRSAHPHGQNATAASRWCLPATRRCAKHAWAGLAPIL